MVDNQLGVYLSIPTSNHNSFLKGLIHCRVFICLFLHQTTTFRVRRCITTRCLSVYSYIKPQPYGVLIFHFVGVYLSIPTSNHNLWGLADSYHSGVYLSIPTSNHNISNYYESVNVVFICLFLHQTTTYINIKRYESKVFICLFLHQTTTADETTELLIGCLSVYSYIKPQRWRGASYGYSGVYLSIPTSNHNRRVGNTHRLWGVYLSIPTSNHNVLTELVK